MKKKKPRAKSYQEINRALDAALAKRARLRRADPSGIGAREPVWAVRPDMNARLALL